MTASPSRSVWSRAVQPGAAAVMELLPPGKHLPDAGLFLDVLGKAWRKVPRNSRKVPQNFRKLPQNFRKLPRNFRKVRQNPCIVPHPSHIFPEISYTSYTVTGKSMPILAVSAADIPARLCRPSTDEGQGLCRFQRITAFWWQNERGGQIILRILRRIFPKIIDNGVFL